MSIDYEKMHKVLCKIAIKLKQIFIDKNINKNKIKFMTCHLMPRVFVFKR